MEPETTATPRDEIVEIVRELQLTYPIETLDEFVSQISGSREAIVFRGVAYDAEFASRLLPTFYLPIASEQDLVEKAYELLIARGLAPVSQP
ncbi:MAG TPA: hypothetical protein VFZ66_15500 [Herpetosiphonaceae bacterium]